MESPPNIRGHLIVSCQALDEEPLHSPYIMGKMACAAAQGGARGIRANSVEDIREIKLRVDLPIIGIIKREYPDSPVYITPTMREIDELSEVEPDIIAIDATDRSRPGGTTLDGLVSAIRAKYPGQLLMADCSTVDEAIHADSIGFDFIGTTMIGYTAESAGDRVDADDFRIIREFLAKVNRPVIAEGNINTPEKAKRVIELGCYSVVVGSAITRPQLITKRFADAVDSLEPQRH